MEGEFYEKITNTSKVLSDRYRNTDILKDTETGQTIIATKEIKEIPVKSTDRYHRVQSHEVFRLDIIANHYYRNPLLWWIIAQANNIYDPIAEIPPGTILRIPSIEALYGIGGVLV